ncbi:hypothetical protein [Effusibacillus pohliae]|nr:hypothetical protein [Effusibacillus pohliae]
MPKSSGLAPNRWSFNVYAAYMNGEVVTLDGGAWLNRGLLA